MLSAFTSDGLSSEYCPALGPLLDDRDMSTRPKVWSGKGRASQREDAWLWIVSDICSPRSRKLTHTYTQRDKGTRHKSLLVNQLKNYSVKLRSSETAQ